jgi:Cu+-exporting ATPase
MNVVKKKIKFRGMHCASCAINIESTIKKMTGINSISVNYATESGSIEYDLDVVSLDQVHEEFKKIGYSIVDGETKVKDNISSDKKMYLVRFVLSLVLGFPVIYMSMGEMLGLPTIPVGVQQGLAIQALFSTFVIALSYKMLLSGFKNLIRLWPNMDSLVFMGTFTAYVYSVYAIFGGGKVFFESAIFILIFINLGKYLETMTKIKTGDAVNNLINLKPKDALVLKDGKEVSVMLEHIEVGDLIIIKPGSSIPVDGVVIEGYSGIDESMVTGESVPVEKTIGAKVIAGTVNQQGRLLIKAQKVGSDTFLYRVINVVEEALNSKSNIQVIADKISAYFVPVVFIVATFSAFTWLYFGNTTQFALNIFISVLVIACPCALGLATPTAIMMGVGLGTKQGILIKNTKALESAGKINKIVFDKTGTLTIGKPEVVFLEPFSFDENEMLKIAYSLEKSSEHPLAKAILNKYHLNHYYKVESFKAVPGKGLSGIVEGKLHLLGTQKFLQENNIDIGPEEKALIQKQQDIGRTVVLLAQETNLIGLISIADVLRAEAIDVIRAIKRLGVEPVIISGDSEKVVKAVANKLGVDNYFAEVLPEDKFEKISKLQNEGNVVAMVGDGFNDAPALAKANLGIVMGSGTDVAIESGDMVILRNNLFDVVKAIKLGSYTNSKIKQNFFWAFIYNLISLPIAAGVLYPLAHITLEPSIAAAAMSFSSVSVVLNALSMRAYKFPNNLVKS